MTPDFVVDVGNTRIKVGVVRGGRIAVVTHFGFIPESWNADDIAGTTWVIAGVNPKPRDDLARWSERRGAVVTIIDDHQKLPLFQVTDAPDRVGIDRLLGAVAANRLRRAVAAAMTVDSGTATTINCITTSGTFCGGFILPGLRLMASSLQAGTAQLPEIDFDGRRDFPGANTDDAIRGGIIAATCGAIRRALVAMKRHEDEVDLFVTGGAAIHLMEDLAEFAPRFVPNLVLEGLLLTAEALP